MRRRDLLCGSVAAALCAAPALAQQKPLPVIGFLNGQSAAAWAPLLAAFRGGLAETGYVEGKNVRIEYRWAEGNYERLPVFAAELVGRNVNVIVATGGSRQGPAVKQATSTIPIVFTTGSDPVAEGLVANLAHPGGNVTGFTVLSADLMEKRLEVLAEVAPQAKVIALLVNPDNPNTERYINNLPKAAQSKGLRLEILKASTETEIDAAFAALRPLQAGALLAGTDAFFNDRRQQIVALAAKHAIPAIYDAPGFMTVGGLMSYGPSFAEIYRQVGIYAGKILRGAKPADLPVQEPTKFELVINLETAKVIGLTVPQSLLRRADRVIE
ncbi:MAG TPA: ABC transporter substrate-binding protein [Stellaceae bacterium]|nr:ABC transporter substrate-binding protein [Stellaceae bacterium]